MPGQPSFRTSFRRGLVVSSPEELVEEDPEDTFYRFVTGIWNEMERKGDACNVSRLRYGRDGVGWGEGISPSPQNQGGRTTCWTSLLYPLSTPVAPVV